MYRKKDTFFCNMLYGRCFHVNVLYQWDGLLGFSLVCDFVLYSVYPVSTTTVLKCCWFSNRKDIQSVSVP